MAWKFHGSTCGEWQPWVGVEDPREKSLQNVSHHPASDGCIASWVGVDPSYTCIYIYIVITMENLGRWTLSLFCFAVLDWIPLDWCLDVFQSYWEWHPFTIQTTGVVWFHFNWPLIQIPETNHKPLRKGDRRWTQIINSQGFDDVRKKRSVG